MKQQISVITLGIADLGRSRRFYTEGFGWIPVFENDEIIFYQMNGFVLGTFLKFALESDMDRDGLLQPGAFSLAHNVEREAEVTPLMNRLVEAGGNYCAGPTCQSMAVFAVMSPTPTITPGKLLGTRPGQSTRMVL